MLKSGHRWLSLKAQERAVVISGVLEWVLEWSALPIPDALQALARLSLGSFTRATLAYRTFVSGREYVRVAL